jgi:DNA-binding HxlR family transcriptional regulator
VPPKVEYSLTEKGNSLRSILLALREWADVNLVFFDGDHGTQPSSTIAS